KRLDYESQVSPVACMEQWIWLAVIDLRPFWNAENGHCTPGESFDWSETRVVLESKIRASIPWGNVTDELSIENSLEWIDYPEENGYGGYDYS
ncbi:MAG: hypothetical protein Q9173_006326, partial [Seirophora scorigena]